MSYTISNIEKLKIKLPALEFYVRELRSIQEAFESGDFKNIEDDFYGELIEINIENMNKVLDL